MIRKKLKKQEKKETLTPTAKELRDYKERAVKWSEDLPHKKDGLDLVLDHVSYQAWVDEYVSWLGLQLKTGAVKKLDDEFAIQLRLLPFNEWYYPSYGGFMLSFAPAKRTKTRLSMFYGGRRSYSVTFDGDVYPLMLVDQHNKPWMSLVPNEVFTQRPGIKRAKGNVLIAGLGLGWLARKVLERPQVKHMTIVEKSRTIIDTFGKPFKDNPKVTMICADVYDYLKVSHRRYDANYKTIPAAVAEDSPLQQYDSVLFDIWEHLNGCSDDYRWITVKDKAKSAWQWGTMRSDS